MLAFDFLHAAKRVTGRISSKSYRRTVHGPTRRGSPDTFISGPFGSPKQIPMSCGLNESTDVRPVFQINWSENALGS